MQSQKPRSQEDSHLLEVVRHGGHPCDLVVLLEDLSESYEGYTSKGGHQRRFLSWSRDRDKAGLKENRSW